MPIFFLIIGFVALTLQRLLPRVRGVRQNEIINYILMLKKFSLLLVMAAVMLSHCKILRFHTLHL